MLLSMYKYITSYIQFKTYHQAKQIFKSQTFVKSQQNQSLIFSPDLLNLQDIFSHIPSPSTKNLIIIYINTKQLIYFYFEDQKQEIFPTSVHEVKLHETRVELILKISSGLEEFFQVCSEFIRVIQQNQIMQRALMKRQEQTRSLYPNKLHITRYQSLIKAESMEYLESIPKHLSNIEEQNNGLLYNKNNSAFKQAKLNEFINYIFEVIDQQNNCYKFDTRQLAYFGKGADHVVFHNINPTSSMVDKVLIFKKEALSQLDQEILEHYMNDLMKDQIAKYLDIGVKVKPKNKQNQKVLSLLKEKKEEINFSTAKFTISTNAFYNYDRKWDICLQFKPKSLMPSKYGIETIRNIAQNFNVSQEILKKQISKADIIEKLTWFKKVTCSGKKISISPLELFAAIQYECNELDFTKSQLYKEFLIEVETKTLNRLILSELRKSSVLKHLHRIMSVYQLPNLYGVSSQLASVKHLPVALPQVIWTSKQIFKIQQAQEFLRNQTCIEQKCLQDFKNDSLEQKWERLYRLLVFRSWNDISLVVKLKLNSAKDEVIESQIRILDFQLWQVRTVQKRTTSQKEYLRRYLEYKGLINTYGSQSFQIKDPLQLQTTLPNFFQQANLKYLTLDRNNLGSEEIKILLKGNWPHLKFLSLDANRIQAKGCNYLVQGKWPDLIILNLNSNRIRNQGLKVLTDSNWDQLQEMSLDWNQINEQGIQNLGRWKNLKKITLTFCKIGLKGARSLVQCGHTKLKILNLYNNSLKAEGMNELKNGYWPQLEHLNLAKNQLVKDSFTQDSLSQWPNLRSLDLSINSLMSWNSELLITMNITNIQQLKLCYNKITVEGMKNFIKIPFKCLRKLDLYLNLLKNTGIKVFCQKEWSHLQSLNLTRNEISDFGLNYFVPSQLPKLQKLILYHNKITLSGVKTIMGMEWEKLNMIDIAENGISEVEFTQSYREIAEISKIKMESLILN